MTPLPSVGPGPWQAPAAAAVALLLDELLGEPPARWHPVVAMGAYLSRAAPLVPAPPAAPAVSVAAGGLAWSLGAAASAGAGVLVARAGRLLPWPGAALLDGAVLWSLLSSRLLRREVCAVEDALGVSLADGRRQVSRLVSRDTAVLDAEAVRGAALGSLSENLSDSVVAPLLAHAAGGVPGAVLYRYANTADAMWGYRTPRWLHGGRVAARADDVANLVPSRLSAVLLLAVARSPRLLGPLRREARRTPSPNGGWPMGAMALVLGVRLVKPGVYALHPDGRAAGPGDTRRAVRLVAAVTWAAWPVAALVALARGAVAARAARAAGAPGAAA